MKYKLLVTASKLLLLAAAFKGYVPLPQNDFIDGT
jgi:hypothetical protein